MMRVKKVSDDVAEAVKLPLPMAHVQIAGEDDKGRLILEISGSAKVIAALANQKEIVIRMKME